MSIKGVLNNLKKKGIKGTWGIYVERNKKRKLENYFKEAYLKRPFLSMKEEEKTRYFADFFEKEKALQKEYPKIYKAYLKDMKALYIKERIPQLYKEASQGPVENKVIFMESGGSPSPSNQHISEVMQKEGKYKVHMESLRIRQVSNLEFYENALGFIKEAGNAKAIFLSTANDLLSHFDVRPETKVIQLWHGVGVFKKIGYSTVDNKNFGKSAAVRKEYDQYRNYSYVTIAAPEQEWIFEEAMNIEKGSGIIVPIGVSRTDVFYDPHYYETAYNILYEEFPQTKGKKIILYAPTFRGEVGKGYAPDQLDIDAFGEALGDEYVLVIKHHTLSKKVPPIPEKWKDSFAFEIKEKGILDIEQLLAIADICITDYSSIAFEYAIMERPLIFYAYDLEQYIDDRGLYYNYDEITPGPVCKTNEEIIDYILNINERFDKQEIIDFKNKHVGACDGHSTERTIALIES